MIQIESQLEQEFSDRFRRIWVQRSKLSVCITLFPKSIAEPYKIITLMNAYKGIEQETKIGPLRIAIQQFLSGK
jgi:hypothetical protein